MQPYRYAKHHHPGECPECVPTRPGHQLCQHDSCDNPADIHHLRHATAAEYDALPEHFKPIDGIAHQAVFTCYDHEIDPICGAEQHGGYTITDGDIHGSTGLDVLKTAPAEPACPKCGAAAETPCVKANGKPRSAPHPERDTSAPEPAQTACRHVHREDCGGQSNCICTADDTAPHREPRIITPAPPPAPAPIHVPTHGEVADFLADNGIDVDRVLNLELVPAADGPVTLRAILAVTDHNGDHVFDQHGQRQAEVREIHLTPTHPTDPVQLP